MRAFPRRGAHVAQNATGPLDNLRDVFDRDGGIMPAIGFDVVPDDDALSWDRPAVRSELKKVFVAVQPLSVDQPSVPAVRQVPHLDAVTAEQGVEVLEVHLRAGLGL